MVHVIPHRETQVRILHHQYKMGERVCPVGRKPSNQVEPNTIKLDILARIQRYGIHGAKHVNGQLVHGALAECKDGVWTLTKAGQYAEAGHIRKTDCAQFTGKVR